jgi:hypothetical protein
MAVINNFENVSPVAILASRIAARVQDATNQYKVQIRTLDLSSDV